jgi:hypothetical protein
VEKFIPKNLKTLMLKWNIKQVDLQKMLNLERGNVSEYINKGVTPKVVTLLLLEELTGITVYRWMNSSLSFYDFPDAPLSNYTYSVNEPATSYGPNLGNTPLAVLLDHIHSRIDKVTERVSILEEKCQ